MGPYFSSCYTNYVENWAGRPDASWESQARPPNFENENSAAALFWNRTETQSVTAGNQKLQNLLSSFSPNIPHLDLFSGLKTFLGFSSVGFRNNRIGFTDVNYRKVFNPVPSWYFSRICRMHRWRPFPNWNPTISQRSFQNYALNSASDWPSSLPPRFDWLRAPSS